MEREEMSVEGKVRGEEERREKTLLHYSSHPPEEETDNGSGPSQPSPDTECHRDRCSSLLNVISSLWL